MNVILKSIDCYAEQKIKHNFLSASKKPEIVKETPDNSKDVPSKVLKDKTPKTPQGVVLQDVTDASSSQRITRSVSAKTPQPSGRLSDCLIVPDKMLFFFQPKGIVSIDFMLKGM